MFNYRTDDESSSDDEYDHHSQEDFEDEAENGASGCQEAWQQAWSDSEDEERYQVQQMLYEPYPGSGQLYEKPPEYAAKVLQERGRRVAPLPTEGRSGKPKKPPPLRTCRKNVLPYYFQKDSNQ